MACDSAGCAMWSLRAARVIWPSSATVTKYLSCPRLKLTAGPLRRHLLQALSLCYPDFRLMTPSRQRSGPATARCAALHAAGAGDQDGAHEIRAEQPVLNDARRRGEARGQLGRVSDRPEVV